MTHRFRSRRSLLAVFAVIIALAAMAALLRRYLSRPPGESIYRDSFVLERQDDWQPFGGTCEAVGVPSDRRSLAVYFSTLGANWHFQIPSIS